MISSLDVGLELDEILDHLLKLINGWDLPKLKVLNAYFGNKIIWIAPLKGFTDRNGQSELGSHANMVVCGRYCWIISHSSKFVYVAAFVSKVGEMKEFPIIDAFIAYD